MAYTILQNNSFAARTGAILLAATAAVGLIVQFAVSYQHYGSAVTTLWTLLAYFTITTNLLVAVVFLAIATYGMERCPAYLVAGTMLSILLVGVIYYLLLHGLSELSGGSQVANVLLHVATPIAGPLFWLFIAPKGRLRWRDPILWAAYPLAYFFYALLRGGLTGVYPYPFMNVLQLGWERTLFNAVVIAAGYLTVGFTLVSIDRLMSPDRDKRI